MDKLIESLKKCKVENNVVFLPPISGGPLPNYPEFKKALEKAGGKYKKNTFVFPSDAQPYIDRLIGGESVNIKKEFQFFATPDHLADRLVDLAEIKMEHEILEPSAGQGAVVKAIHRATYEAKTIWGYELMPQNQKVLEKIIGFRLLGNDFLQCNTTFDRIIANPPFAKNQDIDHIRHMYDCLRLGGRIVTIASKHWTFASGKKENQFREWLKELDAQIIELGPGEFNESGTQVASVIVIIDKF